MRQFCRACVAVTATGIVLTSAVSASAAVTNMSAPSASPVGTAPAVPLGARTAGAAPLDEQVAFDVVLRPRDQSGLDALVSAVSTPGSSQYGHFLHSGEFANRFGPTASSVGAVRTRLQSLGLTVGAAHGSLLPVTGSLSHVSSALHTSFVRYRLASGRLARANVAAPEVPADIAGSVQAIVGLDDLAQFTHPVPTAAPSSTGPAIEPQLAGPSACPFLAGQAGTGFYTAPQLASYYGLTSAYAAGTRGSGMSVAVVELEAFEPSDIAQYQSCYGTTTTVATTNVDGGPVPAVGSGSGESALDIEDIVGLAPDASIQVYQGPNGTTALLDVYQAIANDNSAQVVSTSWGLCEAAASSSFVTSENTLFQQMAAQGQTVLAASGDAGSADCDGNPPPNPAPNSSTALAVDDPASQPAVTGVGGTDLKLPAGTESTWNRGIVNNGGSFSVSAGGGGQSKWWQMPSYQTALGNIAGSDRLTCGAPSGSLCREVPDVSASADPSDGYAIYYAGAWRVFGGTSAAAPTWASLLTLVDASCGGHRLGLINTALYQLRTSAPGAFNDITSGNNDGAGANGNKYPAIAGYDMATGLGTPVGAALSSGLCPVPSSNGVGTVTADHNFVPASSLNTVRFTYHAPNGNRLTNGKLSLVVPAGWSAPSTTPGNAGYTTASAGTVTVTGSTINVTGVTTAADATFTVTYGDTASSGPGAVAPASQQVSTFTAQEASTAGGTLTTAGPAPQIAVGQAPDGSGTMTANPTSVPVTTPTTLTFTYAPPAGATTTNGVVTVAVPAGWTAPKTTTSSTPGFVTSSTGTLTVSGMTIRVSGLTLSAGGSLTIVYGDTAGGTNPTAAATPPSSATTSTFTTQEQSSAGGSLTTLAGSPTVSVVVPGSGGGGGGGGGAAPSAVTLTRVAGPNRVATSVAASQTAFPTAKSATAVVLARADAFADALAGTPLAVSTGGPLLLTGSSALDPAASAEIQRVLTPGATVYLLGGTSALSTGLANAVVALGHPLVRIAGPDRFATAVAVATALGDPAAIFEADGTNFPDALSAGTAAAQLGGVVLLTSGSTQSPATASYLAAHPTATRYAIGGPAAAADRTATPFIGTDRFDTSVLVAQAFFGAPQSVGLASGVSFPDALAGGSVAGMNQGPMVLVPSSGPLPASVGNYLSSLTASATVAWLFGGTSSVGADVFSEAAAALAPAA